MRSRRHLSISLRRFVRIIFISVSVLLLQFPMSLQQPVRADGWHKPPFHSDPYDFWRRNRERLGFSPQEPDPKAKPSTPPVEIDDLDKAEKQYQALLKKMQNEKEAARRAELQKQLSVLGESITAYQLAISGTGNQAQNKNPSEQNKRRRFIHTLIQAAAYVNSDNLSYTEFPNLLKNRKRFQSQLRKILKEIGAEAVPQLWEHLRNEIVYHGAGKNLKEHSKEEIGKIHKRIQELRTKQKSLRDKGSWNTVETHIKTLQQKVALLQGGASTSGQGLGPIKGVRSQSWLLQQRNDKAFVIKGLAYDRYGFIVSKDFASFLAEALVVLGVDGMEDWLSGCWDPNRAVQTHVREMIVRIGPTAVPVLVQALRENRSQIKRRGLSRTLVQLTQQDFKGDPDAYEKWYNERKLLMHALKKKGLAKLPDEPPGNNKRLPVTPDNADQDDLQIGPRK